MTSEGDSTDSTPTSRSAERVKVEAFVKVVGGEGEFVLRTRDLSPHGVFLYTRVARTYPFRAGSTLDLELYDYDSSITCKVVVVRVVEACSAEADHYPTGFGVRIVDIATGERLRLDAMIERIRERGGIY